MYCSWTFVWSWLFQCWCKDQHWEINPFTIVKHITGVWKDHFLFILKLLEGNVLKLKVNYPPHHHWSFLDPDLSLFPWGRSVWLLPARSTPDGLSPDGKSGGSGFASRGRDSCPQMQCSSASWKKEENKKRHSLVSLEWFQFDILFCKLKSLCAFNVSQSRTSDPDLLFWYKKDNYLLTSMLVAATQEGCMITYSKVNYLPP